MTTAHERLLGTGSDGAPVGDPYEVMRAWPWDAGDDRVRELLGERQPADGDFRPDVKAG
ncbi:hypothetical protein ACQKM2_33500 [Streptomyces sp. NPDC004126]|uniref:hypothetical protein n=1 Tax=Streptomyces sp. NPDC004126 TaxID=3390695 RepID=UPI003D02B81E